MKKVWVVEGNSESSDHYLAVFKDKPTSEQLKHLAHSWDGIPSEDENDEDAGPGYAGSFVQIVVGCYQVQ